MTREVPTAHPKKTTVRLAYIDWMRGLACLLMFQAHCYDAWLKPELHQSDLYKWSQKFGTLPAPLFIFLSGISFALLVERLREKGASRNEIAKSTLLRGAEIFALGLAFRTQEFVLGFPRSPWTDLLRVDILNILGLGMMIMSVLCWSIADVGGNTFRKRGMAAGILTAALVAIFTPPLWTTNRPQFLPWPLESYINGVHIFHESQTWLFPLFPWSAFAFVGLSIGFLLLTDVGRKYEPRVFAGIGGGGAVACVLALVFDAAPIKVYAAYDYWHTSPNFLLVRCGVLMIILFSTYAWCRWGLAQKGFSPVIQLGQTSLLVYWVHMEFVYGRLSILHKGRSTIPQATIGLATIFLAMLGLSVLRTRYKKRSRGKVQATPPSTVPVM